MITKKIPVDQIKERSIEDTVRETLKNDPKNAYTILGLMVEKFGIKESDIASKPFNQWRKGLPTMYTKIRLALDRLVKEGKVRKQKVGKAYVYWWIGDI
jgi:DNA-binding transcriptional regulator PaaX